MKGTHFMDARFRSQLKSFTEQGKKLDQQKRDRITSNQMISALDVQSLSTTNQSRTQDNIDESNRTLMMLAQPQQLSQKQMSYVDSQKNINYFLQSVQQAQRRNISDELHQQLSILRPTAQEIEQTIASQVIQTRLEFHQPPKKQDPVLEPVNPEPEPFIDTQLCEKNERCIPYMYVLASYLDLKGSSLFIKHYENCMKIVTKAYKLLSSQKFVRFVSDNIAPANEHVVFQQIINSSGQITKELIHYFIQCYEIDLDITEKPQKKASTYLQVLIARNDALLQLFVTVCFWKLGGGEIAEDEYRRFPVFIQ